MAKNFKKEAKTGLDALIQPTVSDTPKIEKENTIKTSFEIEESLYIEFKLKYLIPNKMTLKDFIINSMKNEIEK